MDNLFKAPRNSSMMLNEVYIEKWNLAKRPEDNKWSPANFYEDGVDSFGLLTHYHEYFN